THIKDEEQDEDGDDEEEEHPASADSIPPPPALRDKSDGDKCGSDGDKCLSWNLAEKRRKNGFEIVQKKSPKGNPQQALKDKGVIDSGCSRHMTGNMSYLSDFEELNGGYVAFGDV
nr:ribonuclease H-like domain-containing protein [Tanacetum cinerariifolium]